LNEDVGKFGCTLSILNFFDGIGEHDLDLDLSGAAELNKIDSSLQINNSN
jgi:hypothetical protein